MISVLSDLEELLLGPAYDAATLSAPLLAAFAYGAVTAPVMQDYQTNGGYGHEPQPKPHQGDPGKDGKGV